MFCYSYRNCCNHITTTFSINRDNDQYKFILKLIFSDFQYKFLLLKISWCIMQRRIRQQRPQTVKQLKSFFRQEWTKLLQLAASVPKYLKSVIKRKGDQCVTSVLQTSNSNFAHIYKKRKTIEKLFFAILAVK